MKKALLLAVTAVAALLAASCQKEEMERVLRASIEQYEHNSKGGDFKGGDFKGGNSKGGDALDKAYINADHYACWENNDTVNINGTRCAIRFEEGTHGTANSAIIDGASFPAADPLMAFYPADMVSNLSATGGTVTLPQVQNYEETTVGGVTYQKIPNPMAAYCPANSDELKFRNLCALLKITIQAPAGEGLQVKDILVKGDDDQMLWGTATLKLDNQHRPMLSKMANGSAVVRLKFDTPVEIVAGASQSFYIVVPASSTFFDFSIIVFTGQEKLYMKESDLGQGLLRNQIGALTYTPAEADAESGTTILYEGSIDGFLSDAFGDARVIFHAGGFLIFDRALTTIGRSAFESCGGLKSISLPAGVTSIGGSAFYGCSSLSSISLPANLTSIGTSAFGNCSSLSSISLPAGVTSIEGAAFYGCRGLSSITLPANLTSIGNSAFFDCRSLSSISLPAGVTSIGKSAFYNCTSLGSISLPASLTSIGESAFEECNSLDSIDLSLTGVTSIERSSFRYCSSLSSISLPAGLTSIGGSAFSYCSGLQSISLPAGVTSIGGSAFWGCSNLGSIDLSHTGVTSIGESAFYGCRSLSSISLPANLTTIGETAFSYCSSLENIDLSPTGMTTIGGAAFSFCTGLSSISLPTNLTSIENDTFYGCRSLGSIALPVGVTSIGNSAFFDCKSLGSISLPANLTSIGNSAFWGCSSLTTVYVNRWSSGSPQITSGGTGMFNACTSLSHIYVPNVENDAAVNAYKSADYWSAYSELIFAAGTEE